MLRAKRVRVRVCVIVSKGVALVCETRTEHELESRRGGREGEVLGRRRVVEWKLKKKEGDSSPAQRRQRICCCCGYRVD